MRIATKSLRSLSPLAGVVCLLALAWTPAAHAAFLTYSQWSVFEFKYYGPTGSELATPLEGRGHYKLIYATDLYGTEAWLPKFRLEFLGHTWTGDDVDLSAAISWDNDNTRFFEFVIGVKQAVWNVPRWEPDGDPSWVLDARFFADVPVNFGFLIDGAFGPQSRPGAPVRIDWSGRGGDHLAIAQSLLPEPGALGLAAAGLLMLAGLGWTGREQKRIHEHR
jgi:hypothetical protein